MYFPGGSRIVSDSLVLKQCLCFSTFWLAEIRRIVSDSLVAGVLFFDFLFFPKRACYDLWYNRAPQEMAVSNSGCVTIPLVTKKVTENSRGPQTRENCVTIPSVTKKSQKSHSVTITSVTEKLHATPGAFKQASSVRQKQS